MTAVANLFKNVLVNGHTFNVGENFPTTGFEGATFTLQLESGNAADLNWKSNASWVAVNEGKVTFIGQGDNQEVVITATSRSNTAEVIKYSFRLNTWYSKGRGTPTTFIQWEQARDDCNTMGNGYRLPTFIELAAGAYTPRQVGILWNEWGNFDGYPLSGIPGGAHWTSDLDPYNSGWYGFVYMGSSSVDAYQSGSLRAYTICRKQL